VTDRIKIKVEELPGIENAIKGFGDYIKTETLADVITLEKHKSPLGDLGVNKVEWLDGEMIGIGIEKD
jgi:hypothetical protein